MSRKSKAQSLAKMIARQLAVAEGVRWENQLSKTGGLVVIHLDEHTRITLRILGGDTNVYYEADPHPDYAENLERSVQDATDRRARAVALLRDVHASMFCQKHGIIGA